MRKRLLLIHLRTEQIGFRYSRMLEPGFDYTAELAETGTD